MFKKLFMHANIIYASNIDKIASLEIVNIQIKFG